VSGWRGERNENWWSEGVFSLGSAKFFLLKSRGKIERKTLPACVDERTNV